MTPPILVSRSAARLIFAEVQRWVDRGLRDGGMALESLAYPLSALVANGRALRCPLEPASVDDLRGVVIDGVAIPPDAVKAFSPGNCHFAADDIVGANAAFNDVIQAQVAAQPRLGVHSKLHSHPFAAGAFLSGGDLHHGVTATKAIAWRQRQGLSTAILHVVYPDDSPTVARGPWMVHGSGATGRGEDGGLTEWRIHSWASRSSGADVSMVDLGDAAIVDDAHDWVAAARRRPYWSTADGASWCNAQKAALREAGYATSRNRLGRGWRRYIVEAGRKTLLLGLPPDFPAAPMRVLEVRRAWAGEFEPLDTPRAADTGSLASTSLLDVVRRFGAPN